MPISESIYEALTNEEDTRLCEEIGEDACREAPQNFTFILLSNCLSKLGDAIASPKTTIAWLTSMVGAPAFVLGLLVPIRESGSMVPQLFIGGAIRRLPIRKWVWVAGSVGQAMCIAGMGFVAIYLTGMTAGWAIIGLVVCFSLCRGFCSVAAKDVLGKTIPKPKRGQLTGWSASAAGLLGAGVGIVLMTPVSDKLDESFVGLLLFFAGALWLLAAALYAQLTENAGETGGGRSILDAFGQLRLLSTDKAFRRFVITRALLMCSALSAPFYVALAQQNYGTQVYLLGAFIAASGVASLVSAPVWGRYADASSKTVMIRAVLVASGVGLIVFAVNRLVPSLSNSLWFLPLAYFALSLAHSGVRVGRKTYVVNLASGNKRTDYVAVSNTVIGLLLLVVGAVGALTPILGNDGVIGLLALMGLFGAAYGTQLPDAEA
ncbi:MAG: MFS transporter [Chromatiales bacterium]|nr:MAG: MFS transporter [Chromatiales bacterium]